MVGRWREAIGNEMLTDYERRLKSFFWNGVERDRRNIRERRRLEESNGGFQQERN